MKDNKALLTIFLIVFIDMLGFGLIMPLLPFIAERFSASPQQIGLLTATFSLFQFVAGPILGKLSDRFGRKRLLVISQFGTFVGFVLLAFANSLPLLFLSRVIDGITGGNISIAQAYIADSTNKKNRTAGMGLVGGAFGLGFILGPTLGGLLSRWGYTAPALVAAAVSALSMIVTAMYLKETVSKNAVSKAETSFSIHRITQILKDNELQKFAVIFFLLNLAFSAFQSVFALWAQATLAWDAQMTGYLLGFIGLVLVISQLKILPFLNKNWGDINTLKLGIPLMGIGFFAIALSTGNLLLYISSMLLVLGHSFTGPTLQALATKEVDESQYGATLGMFHAAGSLARIAGPASAGFMFAFHPSTPFLVAATLALIAYIVLPRVKSSLFSSV